MLSLCDIPLADILDYLEKYDGYSIGLSREWGKKHNMSPVIYCEPTSNLLIDIQDLIINHNNNINIYFWKLFSHIKNHEGKLPKFNYINYRFYNEREIRITPQFEELKQNNINPLLNKQEYYEYKQNHNNSPLLPEMLYVPFDYSDIKYIIVKNEDDIDDFKKIIGDTAKINYFTIQQVKKDIIGIDHNKSFINETNIGTIENTYFFINKTYNNKK